jgi:sulfatase maturation enzyme AslB (radical SAM superfamily)
MKVFAVELTNWCNAKCSFCPYPTPEHTREKGYMTWETIRAVAATVGEPKAINISGLGEPTLHKQLVDAVALFSASGIKVQLNTNGRRLNQKLYDNLVDAGLYRCVITSDYFPWDPKRIQTYSPNCPVINQVITRDPDLVELQVRKPLDDWGRQVGDVGRRKVRCSYLHDDFFDIMWTGEIKRCHVDFNGQYLFGNVNNPDDVQRCRDGVHRSKEIPLCANCAGYVFADGITVGDYDGQALRSSDGSN